MLTLLFVVLLLTIFGKLLIFAIKAAWGITKILLNIVLLPSSLLECLQVVLHIWH